LKKKVISLLNVYVVCSSLERGQVLNISKPVKLEKPLRRFTDIDPLGEEDWDD
jgi:hypothetical protein